jgi:tetratricopeptide (TPR) repeat protein
MAATRIRLILALAAFSVVGSPASAQDQSRSGQTSRTWAVVVGISKYERLPGGQQLQFADRDASAFADALKKAGTGGGDVRLLTGAGASLAAIKSAVGNWLAKSASESDTVILFFSGHGIYEREFGEAYLLGYDSDPKDPYTSAFSVSELREALKTRVRTRRVLVLIDAVRRDFFDPEATDATSFAHAFSDLAASRVGASVMIASGPGEFSREGQRWEGHGVFSKHLIEAFSSSGDRNADGLITADELFDFVKARVAEDTSGKQHPWLGETALADLVIARATAQPPVTAKREQNAKAATEVASGASTDKPSRSAPDGEASRARPGVAPARETREQSATERPTSSKSVAGKPVETPPSNRPTSAESAAGGKTQDSNALAKAEVAATRTDSGASKSSSSASSAKVESPSSTPSRSSARRPGHSLPSTASVNAPKQDQSPPLDYPSEVATASAPPPPRPVNPPPNTTRVTAEAIKNSSVGPDSSVPVTRAEAVPSPLILEIEAAIASRNLIEPRNASAWDLYQKLGSDPGALAETARLKPMLANALVDAGRGIVAGDVRADNISDSVDDFKRAGQMFVRARSLVGQDTELAALEKVGAAEALIALQFYDEAERALGQLQAVKLAAIENAMGLVYQGKLDTFRAERALKRAIELNPKWAAPHYNLALLYRSQQNEQALVELEEAATIDPSNPALVIALGDELFARQQWQRAAESFRKAIGLRPSDDALHTKLGHALYSQGLKDEADREYQRARQLRGKQ